MKMNQTHVREKTTRLMLALVVMSLALGALACGDEGTNDGDDGGGGVGEVRTGVVNIAPAQITFLEKAIGEEDIQSVTIRNTGTGRLGLNNITLHPEEDGSREITPHGEWPTSKNLAAGESLTLSVKWNPLDVHPDATRITMTTTDPGRQSVTIQVASPQLAPLIAAENTISFPRVPTGSTESRLTFVQNIGKAPLQVADILRTPVNKRDFKISYPDPAFPTDPTKDSETFAPRTLQPDESFQVRVSFTPESDAPSTASMIVYSNATNGDQFEVRLIGNAGTPCIQVGGGVAALPAVENNETYELNFGQSQIERTSTKTVRIDNCSRTNALTLNGITLTNTGMGVFDIATLPDGLADGPITIGPLDSVTFGVSYSPTNDMASMGQLRIASDDPVAADIGVRIIGTGTNNQCPVANASATVVGGGGRYDAVIDTIPLKTVQFSSEGSSDDSTQPLTYQWELTRVPVNSNGRITGPTTASPTLFLDLAGEYEVELTVYDSLGLASCNTSKVLIRAVPDEDIHVQLVWDTPSVTVNPENNGTDMDLHLLHPTGNWNTNPGDCHWQNRSPDWGIRNRADDNPSLDIDDTNGKGPENINLNNPESGAVYRVGVYYYADRGKGATYATVRIYLEGVVRYEKREKYMESDGLFWDVAAISWPSKQITPIDVIRNGF